MLSETPDDLKESEMMKKRMKERERKTRIKHKKVVKELKDKLRKEKKKNAILSTPKPLLPENDMAVKDMKTVLNAAEKIIADNNRPPSLQSRVNSIQRTCHEAQNGIMPRKKGPQQVVHLGPKVFSFWMHTTVQTYNESVFCWDFTKRIRIL